MKHSKHRKKYDLIKYNFDKPHLDTFEAAAFIGCSPYTLRMSRVTGKLFGKPAPKYIKRGKKVDYTPKELKKCNDQFPEYENTAQAKADQEGN